MIVFVGFLFLAAVAARPQEMGEEVFGAEENCLSKFPSLSRGNVIQNIIFFNPVQSIHQQISRVVEGIKITI